MRRERRKEKRRRREGPPSAKRKKERKVTNTFHVCIHTSLHVVLRWVIFLSAIAINQARFSESGKW